MAYDESLAERVRAALDDQPYVTEQRSFGGLSFLLQGNMCCGGLNDDLVVRVGPDAFGDALALPHARPMDFTGRPMKGWVYVAPDGTRYDGQLTAWVQRGAEFALSLPAK